MLEITLKDEKTFLIEIAKKGYSIRGYADYISMSSGYLSEIIRGKKQPSASIAKKISDGLDKDVADIFLIKMTVINSQKEA